MVNNPIYIVKYKLKIYSSIEHYQNISAKHKKIIFYVFLSVLLATFVAVGIGYTENELILNKGQLEIAGLYGEKIPLAEIQFIELTE